VCVFAKNDTAAVADSFALTVIPDPAMAPLPAEITDGINYINDSTVILPLFAPHKTCCFVAGDFNNWQIGQDYYLNETPDSLRYWIRLNHLIPRIRISLPQPTRTMFPNGDSMMLPGSTS
jgi:hypothetical protein